MSVLEKRIQYLEVADIDYLSARLLLICGLPWSGLPKAAEALEKLFKLFFMLEAQINRNEELTADKLKAYNHNLLKLFEKLKTKIPTQFDSAYDDYMKELQESYEYRYPDTWPQTRKLESNYPKLDEAYSYFRKNVIMNFPPEEQEKVKYFGVGIMKAYNDDMLKHIEKIGGITPVNILKLHNECFSEFTI